MKRAGAVALACMAAGLAAQPYDPVPPGGRVMDPESGIDAVRNIGVRGNRIAAVSTSALSGKETIDAHGRPSFPAIRLRALPPGGDGGNLRAVRRTRPRAEIEVMWA